jgi:hypothetical protein
VVHTCNLSTEEAEENDCEFEASLVRSCLKTKTKLLGKAGQMLLGIRLVSPTTSHYWPISQLRKTEAQKNDLSHPRSNWQ